jgi:DNA-directed RNA polymerase subunit omega
MSERFGIEQIRQQTESKYALVVAAAKRARAIMDGDPPLFEGERVKPVTIALEELEAGEITINVPPVGIK